MKTRIGLGVVVALLAVAGTSGQQPTFRSTRELVSIDVVVRDRNGALVRDLTAADFEVREDGRLQEVTTFSFLEISDEARPGTQAAPLLADVEARVREEALGRPTAAGAPAPEPPAAFSADAVAGRRLIVLLFDVSSMQPDDVQRAVDAAVAYVRDEMSPADLIAVATVGSTLDILTDFTGDREVVAEALGRLGYTEGTATPPAEASTAATDEAADAATEEAATEAAELDLFNNDARLRALRVLSEALTPIDQKKAVIYFSAGMQRSGQDNQVELRAATNAAVRANLAIYPVDTRGLQAIVPGGDATQASGRGVALFSGRGVAQQFSRLAASQDTLTSLAADTGGRAFTDTNDFGDAFDRVRQDISGYYLLGYSSTNTSRDGRFRRVQVRLKRDGLRVEARAGYYADRDFTNTNRTDREAQLQEQITAAVSATDVPVLVTGGWFRLTPDRYYVPIAIAVPGSAVPVPPGAQKVTLDVLGVVRDEQGRPVGRMRQTLDLAVGTGNTLAAKQVLYQSGVTLPPGRFSVKVVVRENTNGAMGTFEAPLTVPELRREALKVSSVVLSTQLQPAARGRTDSPLVRDGVQLLPNLTHVVGKDQKLYFYYEVYEPGQADGSPQLRTSLAFYRGRVKVFETPAVERTTIDAADRRASLFQFELPAGSFSPGLYTCQINIVDAVAGQFSFPRLVFLVR